MENEKPFVGLVSRSVFQRIVPVWRSSPATNCWSVPSQQRTRTPRQRGRTAVAVLPGCRSARVLVQITSSSVRAAVPEAEVDVDHAVCDQRSRAGVAVLGVDLDVGGVLEQFAGPEGPAGLLVEGEPPRASRTWTHRGSRPQW